MRTFLAILLLVSVISCFQLEPTYTLTPKHIVFGVFVAGSSHTTWVLRFLDELAARGHQVTFLTLEENVKFGAAYPRIQTVSTGVQLADPSQLFRDLGSHLEPIQIIPKMFEMIGPNWRPSYDATIKYIETNPVDVMICDHLSDPCMDAAHVKDLPLVITSTLAVFPDAGTSYINNNPLSMDEFTTLHQSFLYRFYNTFVLPLRILPMVKPQFDKLNELKRNAGATNLPSFYQKTTHALKIVSTVFGLDPARPVGPLVELVGPIFARSYPDLDPELDAFLQRHKRVAYVAFGQHAQTDDHDIALISTALLAQVEKGHLDGILWSGRRTPSDPRIRGTRWSPQMAVLLHPSTVVFVSHGGSNSLVEALYAGKRLLFFPFFSDQLGTAKHISYAGLAEALDYTMDQATVNGLVEKVVVDQDGTYQDNVHRYQSLIQIHSQAAPRRAADLVEEVAYTHQGPHLLHREDFARSIPWYKRTNADLYAAVLLPFFLLGCFVKKLKVKGP